MEFSSHMRSRGGGDSRKHNVAHQQCDVSDADSEQPELLALVDLTLD